MASASPRALSAHEDREGGLATAGPPPFEPPASPPVPSGQHNHWVQSPRQRTAGKAKSTTGGPTAASGVREESRAGAPSHEEVAATAERVAAGVTCAGKTRQNNNAEGATAGQRNLHEAKSPPSSVPGKAEDMLEMGSGVGVGEAVEVRGRGGIEVELGMGVDVAAAAVQDGFVEVEAFVEPICRKDPSRFVLFPIKHPGLWEMYKKAKASFWTVEEVDLSQVGSFLYPGFVRLLYVILCYLMFCMFCSVSFFFVCI